jgi:hypothetical protein
MCHMNENRTVRELMGRVRNVVLIFGSGKPRGVGISGGRVYEPGEGNGEVSLRATGERGGFQVSREGSKGEQRGAKGSKGKYALYINHVLTHVYSRMLVVIG